MTSPGQQRPFRIMIAVGGHDVDKPTARLAFRLARERMGEDAGPAQLYAVHVIEVDRSFPLSSPVEVDVERGDQVLAAIEQMATENGMEIETELVQARDTGPSLVGEAEEWQADIVVMGLPYKRRFGDFNLGKTVPYMLKHAPCRVVLLRERLP